MRGFANSGSVVGVCRLSLAVLSILAGCGSPQYELFLDEQEQYASMGGSASEGDASTTTGDMEPATTGAQGGEGEATTDPATTTDTSGAIDPDGTTSATGTTDAAEPPVIEPERPKIVAVELPAKVHAAGPVPLAVQTEHTGAVEIRLDGVDTGELIAAGDGRFTGELPVRGAIDNGSHEVEIIARQGPFEVSHSSFYDVSTPTPGTEAWSMAGPAGSRTNRVARTAQGDLIEVGQTELDGAPRPTIRKRSGISGAELWPEKTIVLDPREGAVVDVAVLDDGRMWVAMNVREPGKDPQPRIALLDAHGHATGVEALGTSGRVVRAIAADADGGCFAVGLAVVLGNWDVAYWRIDAAGIQSLAATFDYQPGEKPHSFADLANDVLLQGDVAWVIGISNGRHDADAINRTRGMIVPLDRHTGKLAAPVTIAPPLGAWTQSAFFGAALHPEGVVATGYGCDEAGATYRIETALYTAAGVRTWHQPESAGAYSYGSDVALDSQGRALIAGTVTKGGKLQGRVFGRMIGQNIPFLFEHWLPGVGPSEALGIVTDRFDRIFTVGYITTGGATQARITRIHG